MPNEKLHFNMQAAIHNAKVRKKQLHPVELSKALAKLTGTKHGEEIYEQILEWKRISEGAEEFSKLFKFWGKEPKYAIFSNKKSPPRHMCKVCGRTFKMKDWKSRFSKVDHRLCLDCERGWRSEYGQLASDGSRRPK